MERTADLLARVAEKLARREHYHAARTYKKPEDIDAEFYCQTLAAECRRVAKEIGTPKQLEIPETLPDGSYVSVPVLLRV